MTMSTPLVCLFLFAAWGIVLVCAVLLWRGFMILKGTPINGFPGGIQHGPDTYWRINRAQANVLENIPYFAIVVLTATALHVEAPILATLSQVVVGARLFQTACHIAHPGQVAVTLRFCGYFTQLICFVWMGAVVAGLV
jgi:uncharacterized MAPEG superfamily protein